jgi:hypothetical protein
MRLLFRTWSGILYDELKFKKFNELLVLIGTSWDSETHPLYYEVIRPNPDWLRLDFDFVFKQGHKRKFELEDLLASIIKAINTVINGEDSLQNPLVVAFAISEREKVTSKKKSTFFGARIVVTLCTETTSGIVQEIMKVWKVTASPVR